MKGLTWGLNKKRRGKRLPAFLFRFGSSTMRVAHHNEPIVVVVVNLVVFIRGRAKGLEYGKSRAEPFRGNRA